MPSTPRMQEIGRKASQSGGPALTREEVAEWHRTNAYLGKIWYLDPTEEFLAWYEPAITSTIPPPDYSAANRYIDSQKPQK